MHEIIDESSESSTRYHTIKELCNNADLSYNWIARCCQIGRIKAVKTSKNRWRIPDDEYQMILRNQKVSPPLPKKLPTINKIHVPDHISDKILGRTRQTVEEPEKPNEPATETKKRNSYWLLPFKR